MDTKTALWRTCDIKSAAFLLYAGFPVSSMGRENTRVFFEFEDTSQRRDALLGFWNREKTVEPVSFLDSLSRARDMVTQTLKS